MKRVLAQAGPMILGLGVLQLNALFDGIIASYPIVVGPTIAGIDYPLDDRAMAAVSFAQRLYQFPLGVFGIAIATAIFPALARLADDDRAFIDTVRRGLRLVIFIGLPASAGLILVREPLAATILQGGDFSGGDTSGVGFVLLGYAPAIWAYSMMHVLTRAFYARGESKTPVKVAIAVVALNLTLNCTLIWTPLREAGLAWSTAICSIIQVFILAVLLQKRAGRLMGSAVALSWIKSMLATAAMIGAVLVVSMYEPVEDGQWIEALAMLVTMVLAGAVVYAAAAMALKMPELRWAIGRTS
jgi:putative peptidoglycan lipid II flippase